MDLKVSSIVESLRGRVLRGVHAGTLAPGDRLPSARDLVSEFDVDHRLILAAYRQLAAEHLVEVRERGGIYVSPTVAGGQGSVSTISTDWFVSVLTDGFSREIPGPELHEWLRRSIETLRLRAVVISTTSDQTAGLARELRDDFGLIAEGLTADELLNSEVLPAAVRRADLVVATAAHDALARRLGDQLSKPIAMIDVRSDLVVGEWALLLRHPVWAVVGTQEFGDMLLRFFAGVRGVENLHILVHGRDDLSVIPDGAPTYVTHRVRDALCGLPVRGHILPAARTISTESARQIFRFIVGANVDAIRATRTLPREGAQRASSG
ncbi:MAG: GntR family transcriptional regulator [Gemmatimonadaceae bacterium]